VALCVCRARGYGYTEQYKIMNIFIIGFGNMGQAIAQSLRKAQLRYDISASSLDVADFEKTTSILSAKPDNSYITLKDANAVILAVKPQDLETAAKETKDKIQKNAILVSIAAGVTIAKIRKLFGRGKIVRVMPNIGLSVGQGISAWKSSRLSSTDEKNARQLLNDLSENFEVNKEELIDAVTAISGSGPAYFFLFAEALEKSATALGLGEKDARALVEKTLSASASLQKGASYEALVRKVASKGGTTEAALRVFKKRGLSRIVEEAAKAAFNRAQELNEK